MILTEYFVSDYRSLLQMCFCSTSVFLMNCELAVDNNFLYLYFFYDTSFCVYTCVWIW